MRTHRHKRGERGRGRCREMVEFLQDYVEEALPRSKALRFERHISDCPGCTSFLSTYRKTVRLGRSLRTGEIPDDLAAKTISFLKERP